MVNPTDRIEDLKKVVRISNRAGLHARPISKFVEVANRYSATLTVTCNGQTVDGKSIIQLMTLAAGFGTELELSSDGEDSQDLLNSLQTLVDSGFEDI
jgi:phosphocarrier protein